MCIQLHITNIKFSIFIINTLSELSQLSWEKANLDNIENAWDGDLWERKRLGIQLTSYVDRLQCGAVLALDARWGEGKTWFVRHWQKHLRGGVAL